MIMGQAFTGNTFIKVKDLIYSRWGYGMMRAAEGGMSFQVGIAQWFAFLICIIVYLYALTRKRRQKGKGYALPFLLLFGLSIFLMTPYSLVLWKSLANFVVIDFTWRVLGLAVFASSVLGAYSVFVLKKNNLKVILSIFLIVVSVYTNRNHLKINQSLDWNMDFFLKLEKTTNSFDEYLPKWVKKDSLTKKSSEAVFLQGSGEIIERKARSNRLEFTVDAKEASKIRINRIYYPGWKVYTDNIETKIDYGETGLMDMELPSGNHDISLVFTDTPLRIASNIISFFSLMVIMGVIAQNIVKSRKYA
jgi:hypothetical protein